VFSFMCKNVIPAYSDPKIIKIKRVFPELWSQVYCHVFCNETQCRTVNGNNCDLSIFCTVTS